VLLGALVGTAVLTGALLVGDSLRGSLRSRVDRQLNGIQSGWVGQRFINADIADKLPGNPGATILLQGTVECDGRRASRVTVIGIPLIRGFFEQALLKDTGAIVSYRLSQKLGCEKGQSIRINVEKPTAIPRGSLLGKRNADDTTQSLRLPITTILPENDPANDFSLSPASEPPLIVGVLLPILQERLGQPGKCNAILASDGDIATLQDAFHKQLTLPDWGIVVRTERPQPTGRKIRERELPYVSFESDRLVLESPMVNAIEKTAQSLGLRSERTTAYLANAILAKGKEIPYSIVASLNPNSASPLGSFLPAGKTGLADDEIVLVNWPESPIKGLAIGDPVTLKFFKPEIEGGAEETTATFRFAGSIPLSGAAADPSLTPPFAGITDKLNVRDWKPPFPYDSTKIKPNDVHELFWQDYRTTPKAYVSLAAGEKYFSSRYGLTTSIRIVPKPGETVEATAERLQSELLKQLDPASGGFTFDPVAKRLHDASKGGQDFGGLFLGFSFFLIGSALLLIGLLFRLAMERRAKEVGMYLATGYRPAIIRRLALAEGAILAGIGSIIGVAIAVPYAGWLVRLLVSLWPDQSIGNFLSLHVTPLSLVIGGIAGFATALLAQLVSLRGLLRIPPPQLLRGVATVERTVASRAGRRSFIIAIVLILVAVILLVAGSFVTNPDAKAGCFFGGGGLLLSACLLLVRAWLIRPHHSVVSTLRALAIRNATRNPGRSLLTVSLVACASFLLVAVESFRRPPPPGDWLGYTLVAETDVPLFQSFESGAGLDDLLLGLEKAYSDRPTEEPTAARLAKAKEVLTGMTVVPLRVHSGDDASCLNLYQAGTPRVLGIPFEMMKTIAPGRLSMLNKNGAGVFTVVEQNTLMWMLKKSIGDTVDLPNSRGESITLRLQATMTDSPFQSELLIEESEFKKAFPNTDGFRQFLIRVPAGQEQEIAKLLETGLADSGMTVTPVKDRIVAFQAVIGAYLTLFQVLGGLGLLLGVAGLAVVLLRNVWDRAGEVALLEAVGYSHRSVAKLILIENGFLLLLGLFIGVVAAAISIAPHRLAGASLPVGRLGLLLGAVILSGLIAIAVATLIAVRRPVISGLRAE
jgi:putative ABC transport system permease protein